MKNYTRSTKLLGVFLVVLLSSFLKVDYTVAAPFEIVNTFEAPQDSSPRGLAWDGTYLWLSDDAQDMIYKLTTNGEVVTSFAWPSEFGTAPYGLTWDGEYLRIVSNSDDKILKLTTEGVWVSEFAAPNPPYQSPQGITWDGSTLWLSDNGYGTTYPPSVNQLTTDGAIIFSFQLDCDTRSLRGLAYDGVNLWLLVDTGRTIYRISTSGEILESFDLSDDIGISGYVYGLTWDDSNLWVATRSPAAIYQLKPVYELQPSIEIILNQTTFATGDELILEAHVTNGPDPDRVEVKMWLENPDGGLERIPHRPIIFLPSEADITKEIFRRTFTGDELSGDWNVGSRLLNPINGDHKSIDIESFTFSP